MYTVRFSEAFLAIRIRKASIYPVSTHFISGDGNGDGKGDRDGDGDGDGEGDATMLYPEHLGHI